MTLKERILSPTPNFFKKIRNAAILLAAVSTTLLTAPVALPAIIIQVAGYVAVSAAVATAISQTVTSTEKFNAEDGK